MLLRMEYVSEVADVVVGDLVVTSGIDGIYPEGLRRSARVEAVEKSGGAYQQHHGRSPPSTSRRSKKCWWC